MFVVLLVKLYWYVVCMYKHVTTYPIIMQNYNVPIKKMWKEKKNEIGKLQWSFNSG